MMRTLGLRLSIKCNLVQRIASPNPTERFEGIAFSDSGNVMAIATSETNSVLLFRRKVDWRFEDVPFLTIGRAPQGLDYPHDVAFARTQEIRAACGCAAYRGYHRLFKNITEGGLWFRCQLSRSVAHNRNWLSPMEFPLFRRKTITWRLAIWNWVPSCFFAGFHSRLLPLPETPEFELTHPSVFQSRRPGVLKVADRWLATANHEGTTPLSIFQRRNGILSGGKLVYGPEPVTVIQDPQLRYPHSVAFTPRTNCLVVTNAGANYFSVYKLRRASTKNPMDAIANRPSDRP